MTTPSLPVFRPTIRTQADLEAVWRELMGPLDFRGHSVWLLVIDDDHPIPRITEITDVTEPPDDALIDGLAEVLGRLDGPGRRFAFLRSRPGHPGLTADDLAWARGLVEAARRGGVSCDLVHRACDGDLVAVPPDALIGGAA